MNDYTFIATLIAIIGMFIFGIVAIVYRHKVKAKLHEFEVEIGNDEIDDVSKIN